MNPFTDISWPGPSNSVLARRLAVPSLLLVCGLLAAAGVAFAQYRPEAVSATRLGQLALALEEAQQPLRVDFARIAISELASTFAGEAALARQELHQGARDKRLGRWAAAVSRQAEELAGTERQITESTPVDVSITRGNRVYLVVGGSPVVLSIPRMTEQALFEQRVLEQFCVRNLCDDLVDFALEPSPDSWPAAGSVRWSFSDQVGPVCASEEGLEIQFSDASDLQWKRLACDTLVAELGDLAGRIALERRNGTQLAWGSVRIGPRTDGDMQRIDLNGDGDYLLMAVPALSATPEFFRLTLPWLAARANGGEFHLVVLNAERLLEPLSFSSRW